jgi:hypothetical protein
MTTVHPNGIYYRDDYKMRKCRETGRWLVIHRPTAEVLSVHDERAHAVAEVERLAIEARREGRK